MLVARHVQRALRRTVIGAGSEIEILPIAIERRMAGVTHAVGHLLALSAIEGVNRQRVQPIGQRLGIGDPLGIVRPGEVHTAFADVIGIDLGEFSRRHIDVPQVQLIVVESDVLAVGRPLRVRIIGRMAGEFDLAGISVARLRLDVQRVLARFVGEIGNRLAVRRPRGRSFHHAGRVRQIADVALIGGHRENFAVRLKYRANAGGGNAGIANFPRHILKTRPHFGEVGRHFDRHLVFLLRRRVVNMDLAELLVNNAARTGGGVLDILPGILDQLVHLLTGGVVAEQGDRPVAVGQEIDLVADPHGREIVGGGARNRFGLQVGEIDDPDIAGAPAAVPFPGDEVIGVGSELAAIERLVCHAFHVRGVRTGERHRQWQSRGQSAVGRHGEELRVARIGLAIGAEQDLLSVGGPAHHAISLGMEGDALGHAAAGRDREHVGVAVVVARERQRGAVGGKRRTALAAGAHGKPRRHAAVAADGPQIAGV